MHKTPWIYAAVTAFWLGGGAQATDEPTPITGFINKDQVLKLDLANKKTVKIEGSFDGIEGFKTFIEKLAQDSPNLEQFHLAVNPKNKKEIIDVDHAVSLANAFEKLNDLKLVWLDRHLLDPKAVNPLIETLKKKKALVSLSLSGNLGTEASNMLANNLEQLPNLKVLFLPNNKVGFEGVQALIKALPQLKNLSRLSLSNNQIGNNGTIALANILHDLPNLKILSLKYNDIGDQGAIPLFGALKNLPNLITLNLTKNNIGNKGAKALAKALKEHWPKIFYKADSKIHLEDNPIGDDGAADLLAVLLEKEIVLDIIDWGQAKKDEPDKNKFRKKSVIAKALLKNGVRVTAETLKDVAKRIIEGGSALKEQVEAIRNQDKEEKDKEEEEE